MTARRAVLAGLATLGARPAALGAALFAGATASVALRAATAASEALRLHGAWGAALLAWLLGTLLGTLLSGAALAAALGAPTAHQALGRGIALLSLTALERILYFMLALAILAPAWRVAELQRPAPLSAAAVACAAVPPLFAALWAVIAFRTAIARTAGGQPSHLALAEGFAAAVTHAEELGRRLLWAGGATAPLWATALWLRRFPPGPAAAELLRAAACGGLWVAAMSWLYASFLPDPDRR